MSSSSNEIELMLCESIYLKIIQKKRVGVHKINRGRRQFGEYHHLFPQLKLNSKRFFQYMRMELETFDYILGKIDHKITKSWCNFHSQPIFPEERLVVSLRYVSVYCSVSFSMLLTFSTDS